MVFQWNSDGSEFRELSFGGNGQTDNYGAPGNSKTGAHHMISAAEAMKRGLPPDLVIAQVSAHSHTIPDNEFKVVNWLHTAAILAQIDPVARGYLSRDAQGRLRLPPLRHLGEVNLNAASPSQTNTLAEYPSRAQARAGVHHACPGRGRAGGGSHCGDVRGAHRGRRAGGGGAACAEASVHTGAAGGLAVAGKKEIDADSGHGAAAHRAASGVRL